MEMNEKKIPTATLKRMANLSREHKDLYGKMVIHETTPASPSGNQIH